MVDVKGIRTKLNKFNALISRHDKVAMANNVQVPSHLAPDTGQSKLSANPPLKLTENGSGDNHQMVSPTATPGGGEVNHTNSHPGCDVAAEKPLKGALNGPVSNDVHRQNHVNKVSHNGHQVTNNNGSAHLMDIEEPDCVIENQSEVAARPVTNKNDVNSSQSDQTDSQIDTTLLASGNSADGLDEMDMGPQGLRPPDVRIHSPSPPREILRSSPHRQPSTSRSLPPTNYLVPGVRRSKPGRRNLTVTGVTDEARIVLEQFLQRSLSHHDASPLRNTYQRYTDYQVSDTVDEEVETHSHECIQINDTQVVRDRVDISPHVQRSTSYREASYDSILSDRDEVGYGEDGSTSHEPVSLSNSIHSASSHSSSFKHKIHVRPTTEQAVYDALAKLKDVEDTVDKKKKSKRKSWRRGSRKNTSSSSSDSESDTESTRRKKSLFKRTTERLRESIRRIQDKPNKYKDKKPKSEEERPKHKPPKRSPSSSPFKSPAKSSKSSTPLTPGEEKAKKFRFSLKRKDSADKDKQNSHRRSKSETIGQVHTHTHVHIHQEVTPGGQDNGIFLHSMDTEMVQDVECGDGSSKQHRDVVMREKESYPVKNKKNNRFDRVLSQFMKSVRRKSTKENNLEPRSKSVDPINLQSTTSRSTGDDTGEKAPQGIRRPVPPELPPMAPPRGGSPGRQVLTQRQNMRLDGLDRCRPATTQSCDMDYETDVVEKIIITPEGDRVTVPVSRFSHIQVTPSPTHSLPSEDLVREGHSDTEDEDTLDGAKAGDPDNKPFHEKTPAEKEELLERVASQLVSIADNYDSQRTPSSHPPATTPRDLTSPGASSCAAGVDDADFIAGATAAPLTTSPSVEQLIGSILRGHGDARADSLADFGDILMESTPRRPIARAMARMVLKHAGHLVSAESDDELNPLLTNLIRTASYDRFRDIVNNVMDDYNHEPGWQQVSMLFRLTKSAVKLTGLGTAAALNIKEMTLKYFEDKFAGWVIGQGGWESMMEDSDLSSEVD